MRQQRHSHRMNRFKPIALALIALLGGCRADPGPAADYRPQDAGTVDHAMCLLGFIAVPIREVATGHHLVEAVINGRSGSFVVDTGANATVVDQPRLQHFDISGLLVRPGDATGVGGRLQAGQVPIRSLRIGGVDIRQRNVVTSDLGQLLQTLGRMTGSQVYGIIGQDVLKEHRAIIDVARPMLYLMRQDRDPAPVAAERCRENGEGAAAAG